jgi:hypothetical protein
VYEILNHGFNYPFKAESPIKILKEEYGIVDDYSGNKYDSHGVPCKYTEWFIEAAAKACDEEKSRHKE